MIKFIERAKIVYEEDNLPYIHLQDVPEDTIVLLEVSVDNKKIHYFVDKSRNVSPLTMFASLPPKVSVVIIVSSNEFVRTNEVEVTDWNKFVSLSHITQEMKIAQLERRIKDIETKTPQVKVDGSKDVGAVLTMCEGGKALFKLPYGFAVKIINGRKPNEDGVIELKMSDFKDMVSFAQAVTNALDKTNERISAIEQELIDINNPVI